MIGGWTRFSSLQTIAVNTKSVEPDSAVDMGFFLLRTPSLPIPQRSDLCNLRISQRGEFRALAAATAGCEPNQALKSPIFRTLLRSASPALLADADRELCASGQISQSTHLAIRRYILRMSTRSTPFGLLAGVTFGSVAQQTLLCVQSLELSRATLRLEARECHRLLILVRDALRSTGALRVVSNPSIVQRADEVHFYCELDGQSSRQALKRTRIVEAIRELAREETTVESIRSTLCSTVTRDLWHRVDDAIGSALNSSLLCVVGADVLDDELALFGLCAQLQQVDPTNPTLAQVQQVISALRAGRAVNLTDVAACESRLNEVLGANPLTHPPSENCGHASSQVKRGESDTVNARTYWDLYRTGTPTISGSLSRAIATAANALATLTDSHTSWTLRDFTRQFLLRFETRAVPLLDALDEFSGISLSNELSADSHRLLVSEEEMLERIRTRALARLLDDWRLSGSSEEYAIDEACCARFASADRMDFGDSFAVHAMLLRDCDSALGNLCTSLAVGIVSSGVCWI